MLVAAGLGFPFPEEVVIVGAGVWTGTCDPAVYGLYKWLMLPVCLLGVLIADGMLYAGGWFFGNRLFEKRWVARMVPAEKRREIQDNFHHYGVSILVFGRLLPGIRAPLFLSAGTMRLSLPRFFLADGLGAVLGNSLLFFLGYWFGDQFKELIERIQNDVQAARPILVLIGISAIGAYLLYHFLKRPVPTGDPSREIPLASLIGSQVATVTEHVVEQLSHDKKKDENHPPPFSRDPEGSASAPQSPEARG
jgi:membrane protein DedA with SNARE-associated domain